MLREDARRKKKWRLYRDLESAFARPGSLSHEYPIASVRPLTDPDANPYVREWLTHEGKDAYWTEFDFLSRVAEISHLPCFHLSGWYDFYARGSMDGYRAMSSRNPEMQKLVAGPWGHIPWGTAIAGKKLGPSARPNTDEMLADWMRRWCGGDESVDTGPPVSYFSMGDLAWHEATTWPPKNTRESVYFLGSHGGANSIFGDGTLRAGVDPAESVADRFVYDPEVPVMGPGAQPGGYAWGPVDLYPSQQGNNILVYRGEPVTAEQSFAGQPHCRLHVRSSATHTAFVARLSINRGEASEFLCLGAARLTPDDLEADGSAQVEIRLDDIAFTLYPGDRLCLDVASSAFPLLARHPNTEQSANTVPGPEAFRRATQVLLHDAAHPSRLLIPEVIHG
jgi:putative CocE/NonD family hydrolase